MSVKIAKRRSGGKQAKTLSAAHDVAEKHGKTMTDSKEKAACLDVKSAEQENISSINTDTTRYSKPENKVNSTSSQNNSELSGDTLQSSSYASAPITLSSPPPLPQFIQVAHNAVLEYYQDPLGPFDAIADGATMQQIADTLQISYGRFHAWVMFTEERQQQLAHARKAKAASLAEQTIDIADGTTEQADSRRTRINARQWLAGRMDRATWGDQPAQQTNVSIDIVAILQDVKAQVIKS